MDQTIAQRMQQVLGKPPRLGPIAAEDLGEAERDAIERLRQFVGWPADAPLSVNLRTLCRRPAMFLSFMTTGTLFLSDAVLPPRDRELAVLRTSWLCGAPFPFGEHVETGKQIGITSDEIDWVKHGSSAPGWSERERAVLQAAEELHADAMIGDPTWAALAACFNETQLVELLMLIGHYHVTSFLQNALRLRLNDYNSGLLAK